MKLNALYGSLLTNGRVDGGGGLSPATVRRIHATLHRAFKDAVRWGYLLANPADAADPPRENVFAVSDLHGRAKSWTRSWPQSQTTGSPPSGASWP